MGSEFLLGVLGLLIVFTVLVGGMIVAGICHELVTPNLDIAYMIWLWLASIPFWWICARTLASERIQRPVATYIGFLPILLLMRMLISQLRPGNPWLLPAMVIAFVAYNAIAERVSLTFARR